MSTTWTRKTAARTETLYVRVLYGELERSNSRLLYFSQAIDKLDDAWRIGVEPSRGASAADSPYLRPVRLHFGSPFEILAATEAILTVAGSMGGVYGGLKALQYVYNLPIHFRTSREKAETQLLEARIAREDALDRLRNRPLPPPGVLSPTSLDVYDQDTVGDAIEP